MFNNPVVFDCLENHKTCKKVYWVHNANFFSTALASNIFCPQYIFSMSHLMSPGIHVGFHVKCLSVTPDFNQNQACIDKYY